MTEPKRTARKDRRPKGAGPERSRRERGGRGVSPRAHREARAGGDLGRGRVSILVVELRGLSRLAARLRPNEVARLLRDFYTVMADVAVERRATIDRVFADALRLLYGFPRPRRGDPVQAVRAALALQRAFLGLRNRWLRDGAIEPDGLSLGIGVATGEVLVAAVGIPNAERALVGEAVETAARLSGAAQRGEVLIDDSTFAAVGEVLDEEIRFVSRELGRGQLAAHRASVRRTWLQAITARPPRRGGDDEIADPQVRPHALR
jgi:class 3 adenylate cyclase